MPIIGRAGGLGNLDPYGRLFERGTAPIMFRCVAGWWQRPGIRLKVETVGQAFSAAGGSLIGWKAGPTRVLKPLGM